MDDMEQTREQLLDEVRLLRKQVAMLRAHEVEHRWTNLALQDRERCLRLWLEQVPGLLWTTDAGLRVTCVVGSDQGLLMPPHEKLVGLSFYEIFAAGEIDRCAIEAHQRALAGEASTTEIVREGRVYQCRIEPFYDAGGQTTGCVGIAVDITDRYRAEEALRASEERFRALVQNSSDLISVIDAAGTIRYESPSVQQILGFSPEERVGKNLLTSGFLDDRPELKQIFAEFVRRPGATIRREVLARHKDGSYRILEVSGTNLLHNPAVAGIITNARDMTERRQAEEERDRLYEAAREALELRDQYISLVRHELGTPMTVLLGYTQLLQRRLADSIPAQHQELLKFMSEQVLRLNRLVTSLLDLPRFQEGRLALERQPLDLAALVRQMLDGMRLLFKNHTLALQIPDREIIVDGDAVRLEQVLHNLLQNALKYSPDGGTIEVILEQCDDWAKISVRDEGIGIPEHDLPHVFRRFFRASNIPAGRMRGMGMGLYVVREIVKLHGGTVEVESTVGCGSTFVVCLPLSTRMGGSAQQYSKTSQ